MAMKLVSAWERPHGIVCVQTHRTVLRVIPGRQLWLVDEAGARRDVFSGTLRERDTWHWCTLPMTTVRWLRLRCVFVQVRVRVKMFSPRKDSSDVEISPTTSAGEKKAEFKRCKRESSPAAILTQGHHLLWPGVEPHGVIPDHHQVLQFALVFAVLCHVEGEEAVRASDGVAFSLGDTSEEVAASLLVGWRRQEPEDKVDTDHAAARSSSPSHTGGDSLPFLRVPVQRQG